MSQSQNVGKSVNGTSSNNNLRTVNRWSGEEDRALVESMNDLVDEGGWKADNGQFKSGTYAKLEALISKKLPGTDKKARPHIESRVKTLRKQFDAVTDMLSASGFGWNDEYKYVTCSQEVWNEWIKSHSNAAGLRNRSFPHYDQLSKIWGKDRATGNEACNVYDVLEEMERVRGEDEQDVTELNTKDINSTSQREPVASPLSTPKSTTPSSNRTKRARTETIEALHEVSTKFGKICEVLDAGTGHIGRLANCFQHESDSAERRKNVISEIMKIEGLTDSEVILASKKIALNPLEVDFFFTIPDEMKYAYVQSLLLPDP